MYLFDNLNLIYQLLNYIYLKDLHYLLLLNLEYKLQVFHSSIMILLMHSLEQNLLNQDLLYFSYIDQIHLLYIQIHSLQHFDKPLNLYLLFLLILSSKLLLTRDHSIYYNLQFLQLLLLSKTRNFYL